MTFEEYLTSKKIDSASYKSGDSRQWSEFECIFGEMHPKSFTMQKLNLINGIRRRFPLREEQVTVQAKPKVSKPVVKPKSSSTAQAKPNITAKPKMGKPVVKSTKDQVIESKPSKPVMKLKMGKPIIKKKEATTDRPQSAKPKPVIKPKMARPVIKKKEEGAEESGSVAKPRPVIKPKIKKKPDDETSSN